MDRAVLGALLNGGPSRCLDVLTRSNELLACDPRSELLFRTPYLNRSIIFKFADVHARGRLDPFGDGAAKPVRTLIYLPYDARQPGKGGEAIVYTRQLLRHLHQQRTNRFDRPCPLLAEDERVLDVLDRVPAFNPFLLNDAFARGGRPVPRGYLALDEDLAERLRRRLRTRVKPLIEAAMPVRQVGIDDAVERMVDAFLDPAGSTDASAIAAALGLEPEHASDLLGAWAGITYLEDELARLTPDICALAGWLTTCNRPREYLPVDQLEALRDQLRTLRLVVREAWRRVRTILGDYQSSYRTLVFDGDPGAFLGFLRQAPRDYWQAGDLCGRFEQSVYAWRAYTHPYPGQPLPLTLLEELLRFLLRTHVVTEDAPIERIASRPREAPGPGLPRPLLGLNA